MSSDSQKQIFYSKDPRRWQYSKRMIVAVSLFLNTVFGVTFASVVLGPTLPQIGLNNNDVVYHPAPNASRPTTLPVSNFGLANPLNLSLNRHAGISGKPKILGFYVNWDDNSFISLKDNIQNIDELVPEWLHLGDATNLILVDDQAAQDKAVNYIKQTRPNLPIVPLINNYNSDTQNWDADRLTVALATPNSRAAVIDAILNFVGQNNFSGISIDFENLSATQQVNLSAFMRELYAKFHPLNLEVSQNIPLDDDSYSAKDLAQYSDFLILMAYDEHSVYDTVQGPIASQDWLISSLNSRLNEAPMNKYVIALGGYGYDWIGNQTAGKEIIFQEAMATAKKADAKVALDPVSLNPTFDYTDENNSLHHVWFLDATTIFNEITIGEKLGGPFGYALWRMGSEDPSLWQVISHRETLNQSVADSLKTLKYGYDISYNNQGEVIKVTGIPQDGTRNLTLDPKSGFIKEEKFIRFPSPYVISRWGGGAANKNKIVLTFDDGPDQKYTPQILSILKKYDAPATFFLVGVNANLNPTLVQQEFQQGNEIGSHTYSHPNITQISDQQLTLELDATQRLIEGIIGRKTVLFRPPFAEDIEPETPDQINPLVFTNKAG